MIELFAAWLGIVVFALGASGVSWLAARIIDWTTSTDFKGQYTGLFIWMFFAIAIMLPALMLSIFAGVSVTMAVLP